MLTTLLAACSNKDDEVPENMQYATVAGSDYRLFLPVDWNLLTDTGVSGGYASAQNKAVIYVKVYDNPDNINANSYWAGFLGPALVEVFGDEKVLDTVNVVDSKLNEHDAITVGYEGTRDLVTYQGQSVVCAKDGKVYVLNFCAMRDLYEGYLGVFDTVKKNFKFSDTPFEPKEPINTVDPDADAPEGMMLASNDDVAYRFYVPKSWVLDKNLPTSSAYVSETDRSNVNVTVYMPEVDHIESVDDYWATCLEELKKGMEIVGEIKDTEITLDSRPGKTYEYTAKISGKTYRFAQTITSYRGMIYTITYTATEESYDTHRDTYSDILAAFDFRGN
jgi:hypothetical protein